MVGKPVLGSGSSEGRNSHMPHGRVCSCEQSFDEDGGPWVLRYCVIVGYPLDFGGAILIPISIS